MRFCLKYKGFLMIFAMIMMLSVTTWGKNVTMKEYKYPLPDRFITLNKKVELALQKEKRIRISTGLSYDECLYYRNVLIYNTTVLRYAISRTRDTLDFLDADEEEYITLKKYDTKCCFIIDGERLSPLVLEAKRNKATAKKLIKKMKIDKTMTEKQVADKFYDYIDYHIVYDFDSRGASDAMKGKGNCAAMSAEYRLFCWLVGIQCEYIKGYTKSGAHAWNRVKADGVWYYIDNALCLKRSKKLWKTHVSIAQKW